jgi:hypothetical protein
MSKLETAAQFISQMEEGRYENKINAQRAAGRTHLPEGEKKKVAIAIDAHFGGETSAAAPKKVGKKAGKKAKKKASKKVATHQAAATPTPPASVVSTPAVPSPHGKKAKKKAVAKKKVTASAKPPQGSLDISPTQVQSVADVLKVIDSTVVQSVSIMNALQRADEINKSGDISEGVRVVKQALVGAAQLLQNSVVAPLRHAGSQADAEVAQRLEQVVNASQASLPHELPPLPLPPPMELQPS